MIFACCHECGMIAFTEHAEDWRSGWVRDLNDGRWFCSKCLAL